MIAVDALVFGLALFLAYLLRFDGSIPGGESFGF
jgi:hypothetical protein